MKNYTTESVKSKDSTTIGYRQMGSGPGLILIHGGMQASQNFMVLGTLLSNEFTVYIPDRRGRGLSGEAGTAYSLSKECEDVEALLYKTGANFVFGLSSGAIIALQAARRYPAIHKVALYEPPLPLNGLRADRWVTRYEREIKNGRLDSAMVTVMKGTGDSWSFSALPRFILTPLMRLGIKADAEKKEENYVPIKALIPTLHYDCLLIDELSRKKEAYGDLKAETLLISGSRSKPVLRKIIFTLHQLLPRARFIKLQGVGHIAADNHGKPWMVAAELRSFFHS